MSFIYKIGRGRKRVSFDIDMSVEEFKFGSLIGDKKTAKGEANIDSSMGDMTIKDVADRIAKKVGLVHGQVIIQSIMYGIRKVKAK